MATPTLPFKSRRPSSSTQSSLQAISEPLVGPFKKLSHIGKGSFAEVYRGIHIEKKACVAIKSVNMSKLNKKLKENLLSEITILRSLHHPHIVALIDCQETPSKMHIIMEFCELGDLSAFIKKRADLANHPETQRMIQKYPNPAVGGLNEVVVRHFAKQIASALEFLRSKNYIHRDLKPQNLLLNPSSLYYAKHGIPESMPLAADENSLVPAAGIESLPMLKIADFGFARILPTTSLAETLCGSPLYMAPEILRYEKYDAKADLWSIGTVLYEMMVARPPFRANNHVELLRRIEERNDHIKFTEGLIISREMKTLIRALLKRKPTERMSYESFFTSPIIRDEIPGLVGEDRLQEPEPEQATLTKRTQKMPAEVDRRGSDNVYSQSPRERVGLGTTPPSRPSSRPTSGQYYGTPPRPTSARRFSNTPTVEQQAPVQRERRSTVTSHATASARPNVLQDHNPAPAAVAMDRRNSRNSPSPTSSVLKDHLDRERIPQRADERALREARERAAQDIAFERDYVLVEKRNVEINALADELAAIPHATRDRPSSPSSGGAIVRRATVQESPISATGAVNPSRAIQIVSSRQPQSPAHQRTGSYERRYRPSFESATSALSKAMNMVNIRGLGLSPPMIRGLSPPQGYSAFPAYPTAQSSLLLVGEGGKTTSSTDEDTKTIVTVEELAQRSHVVYGFAEVKYKQLIPATPSDQGLGIGTTGMVREPSGDAETADDDDDDDLTIDAILQISEEALVLYVKALAILNRSMDLAGIWWSRRNRSDLGPEISPPRSHPTSNSPTALTGRMNHVVQWVRNRFNECCDKAEFVARKLQDAQKQLPLDHPNHPSNRSSASGSATTIGSAENIHLTTGVTAEKLMYDRALEMSRAAAVNELVGEDLPGCELNYWTAIRMLEAIIESDDDTSSRGKRDDDELINGLEAEDRQSVIKLLESMRARLKALKKKIELQKAAKRVSITGTPAPHPPSRSSPSSAGVAR